ncbi:uncharacterized protein KY384_003496 [Bacidia gigantensis]|uniref:uncharacterized protein n=1 Tax=Bacidia gigantensis TaxID=2732470 RepID=UPI001D04A3D9|nr:uncharacterized protein KY384_003496 [Bacidia gigantensis]KAG8531860.1 hypothetical protein KY384_003496 [Bacidia gigantensis]
MTKLCHIKERQLELERQNDNFKSLLGFTSSASAWLGMDCIITCLHLYLEEAIKRTEDEGRGFTCYKAALLWVQEQSVETATFIRNSLKANMVDMIKARFLAVGNCDNSNNEDGLNFLRILSPSTRLHLARHLTEFYGSNRLEKCEMSEEVKKTTQATPRLLACLNWLQQADLVVDPWHINIDSLFEKDQSNCQKIDKEVYCVGYTYTKEDIRQLLKSWAITDTDKWTSFKDYSSRKQKLMMTVQYHTEGDGSRRAEIEWTTE